MFGLVKKSELDKKKVENIHLNRVIEHKDIHIKVLKDELRKRDKEREKHILLNKQKDSHVTALNDEIKGLKDKVNDLHIANEKLTCSRKVVTKEVARDLLKEVDNISRDIRKIIHAHIGLDDYEKREEHEKVMISSDNIMFLSICEKGINNFRGLLNDFIKDKASL